MDETKAKAPARQTAKPTEDPLIAAFDALAAHPEIDGEGIEMSLDYDFLAFQNGADPDWSRPRLVRHQRARKGGLATLARHGRAHYRRMALKRWAREPVKNQDLRKDLPGDLPQPTRPREEIAA